MTGDLQTTPFCMNPCIRELSREIRKYFKLNKTKTQHIKICVMVKSVLQGKFTVSNAYRKEIKKLEKEEQNKPNINRRKEIINIKAEVHKIENK